MKIIDISWPMTPDATGYKDAQDVYFTTTQSMEKDGVRKSRIIMSSHASTHVDAPAHFIPQGKTIDQFALSQLIGTAVVLDLTEVEEAIGREDLEPYELSKGLIVLLKTRNSELVENAPFEREFVYLDSVAAAYLIEVGVKAVGIDYLGIERNQPEHDTHKTLFEHDVPIIEGLRLAHVGEGAYFFVCLPLAVVGLEAAPARAILIEDML
ncbi:cyclase family protein [Candidatus Dependentiae bacterium]|nr:cyclase family protein [Candidatus Dependentiae bacterium]